RQPTALASRQPHDSTRSDDQISSVRAPASLREQRPTRGPSRVFRTFESYSAGWSELAGKAAAPLNSAVAEFSIMNRPSRVNPTWVAHSRTPPRKLRRL